MPRPHGVRARAPLHDMLVSRNSDGNTPLHLAARAGKLEVAELLIGLAESWPEDDGGDLGPSFLRSSLCPPSPSAARRCTRRCSAATPRSWRFFLFLTSGRS